MTKRKALSEEAWLSAMSLDALTRDLPHHPRGGRRTAAGRRRYRLVVCACCRQVWRLFADDSTRQVVEVAERFADGQASETDLKAVRQTAEAAVQRASARFGQLTGGGAWHGPREAMPAGLLAAG